MIVKHLVEIFLSTKVGGDNKSLSLDLISRCVGGLVFISLHLFSKCLFLLQFSPFRLRSSISTRIGFLLQGVTPAQ